jgi:hypothetical protein
MYMCLWTKWHWGRFSPAASLSPANSQFINCSFINHPIIRPYIVSILRAWLYRVFQKELYNFERVYKFIQRTFAVF